MPRGWRHRGSIVFGVVCLASSPSLAADVKAPEAAPVNSDGGEPAAVAPTTDAARLPDIVRLKDGSLFRGTIVEMVSNDYVVILTMGGESKRLALTDVSYAGPVSKDPLLAGEAKIEGDAEAPDGEAADEEGGDDEDDDRPRVVVRLRKARVKVESKPTGHSLLSREWQVLSTAENSPARVESEGFVELCSTPCELRLPPGKRRFALAKPDGRPVLAPAVTIPPGESRLVGTYHDNSGSRTAGIVLTVLAPIAGSVMVALSSKDGHLDEGLFYGGLVTTGVGVGIGVGLILMRDRADIEVERSARSSFHDRDETIVRAESAPGVTWTGAF